MFVNLYDQKELYDAEQDKCTCTMVQKLLGDGCQYCNHQAYDDGPEKFEPDYGSDA
jgi:hypothetical protein